MVGNQEELVEQFPERAIHVFEYGCLADTFKGFVRTAKTLVLATGKDDPGAGLI
jgi:hypothetical protein